MPSRDVASDMAELIGAFGAQVIFAIDDGGTRVAMLELTESPPRILLTDHLDGDRPILVYRVADHTDATPWRPRPLSCSPAGGRRSARSRSPRAPSARTGRAAVTASRSTNPRGQACWPT